MRTGIVAADARGVAEAARALAEGRLVAFPTETVYGLGARAADERAVAALFRAKGRPADHPLIVHLPGADAVAAWADPVPDAARLLAEAFWPGPLTLVLRRRASVPKVVTGGQDTVALRVPAHPVAAALLAALGEGVAAPSANRFGRISPTRAEHVADEFPGLELTILDGGPCSVGLESTIIDLSGARPRLLRPGGTSLDAVASVLGTAVDAAEDAAERAGEPGGVDELASGTGGRPSGGAPLPRAPGRLPSHYAPTAPTRLLAPDRFAGGDRAPRRDAGLLLRSVAPPDGHRGPWRVLPTDPAGYARGLYDALRSLDAEGPPEVVVELPPPGGPWAAVHDRLARAAGPRGDRLDVAGGSAAARREAPERPEEEKR